MSEQVHWDPERAKSKQGLWGCPKCGNDDSRVVEVDRDSDHIRVRLRECTRCATRWATEERRLYEVEAFFARAEKRRQRAYIKHRYQTRRCLVCYERYMSGRYLEHTQDSKAHAAKVALAGRRQLESTRRYRREHARAERAIRKQNAGTAVCDRCGEHYPLNVPYPARTHRGSSEVHRRIIKEEAAARKDRRRQAAKRGHHAAA